MKNLRIAQQLRLAFGAMVLLVLASGVMLWMEIHQSEGRVAVAQRATTGAVALSEAQSALSRLRDGFPLFTSGDEALRKKIVEDEPMFYAVIDRSLKAYAAVGLSPEERNSLNALQDVYGKYIEGRSKWAQLDSEEKLEEAKVWRKAANTAYGAGTVKAFSDLVELQQKVSLASHTAALEELKTLQMVVLVLAMVAIAAAILLSTAIIRGLQAKLGGEPGYAKLVASRIAEGDLASEVEVRQGDESSLLWAMKMMRANLRTVVGDVSSGARAVAETSAQIAQGNTDLSQRTDEQASTLEETASSMEELTSTVAHNAESARQASKLAIDASDVARRGGQMVGQVVSTMTGISESSKKISDIISVIDGIAFQTNILALNAAVEAARAGEQGRGFAVVAAEVRNLAQRSAAAAKEIKTLIGASVDEVGAGTKLVDAAGKTMEEIVTSVKKVSDLIAEIAAASQEQSSGVEEVSTAVTQMDQVVQQNASLVEEAMAATESMKEQAGSLLRTVSLFKLGDERSVSPAVQVAPHRASPVKFAHASNEVIRGIRAAPALAPASATADASRQVASNGEWKAF